MVLTCPLRWASFMCAKMKLLLIGALFGMDGKTPFAAAFTSGLKARRSMACDTG